MSLADAVSGASARATATKCLIAPMLACGAPMLYVKLVLMALFWSGVFPAINIVLSSMGLFTSVFLRFACAALILLVLLRLREHRMPASPRETVLIIGLGILGISVYNVLFSAGLQLVEASRAALIVPTNPAFTALFAAIFLKERLSRTRRGHRALRPRRALGTFARRPPAARHARPRPRRSAARALHLHVERLHAARTRRAFRLAGARPDGLRHDRRGHDARDSGGDRARAACRRDVAGMARARLPDRLRHRAALLVVLRA